MGLNKEIEVESRQYFTETDSDDCCPKCNTLMDFGIFEIDDEHGFYPCSCPNCGFEGTQWYDLVYGGIDPMVIL